MMKLNKVIHNGVASYMQYKGSQPVRSMIGYDKSIPFYVQDLSGESNTLQTTVTGAEYSLDMVTWQSLESSSLAFNAYSKVYLRSTNESWRNLKCTGNFKVGGNMISLIRGADFINYDTVPHQNWQFNSMCKNCTTIIDASELIVPKNVSNWGFQELFKGCTNLVSAPNLSVITAVNFQGCKSMFEGCTSLVNVPGGFHVISNWNDGGQYGDMFKGCTSLVTAPELPSTTIKGGIYSNMFNGCSNLNYVKCLATNVPESGFTDWLNGVSTTGTFVKAAGATWPTGVNGIPEGWTVIEV